MPLGVPGKVRVFRHPRCAPRRAAAALALVTCAATGLTTAAALTASAVPAAAATVVAAKAASPKYWVSQASTSSSDTSCASAAYSTVQSAVTAAEAYTKKHHKAVPTIEVCPGTYAEQLTITSSLAITRAPVAASQGQAVIQLPAAVGESATAGQSSTYCQDDDAATSTLLPTPIIEICSALAGGVNTTGVSVSISHLTVQGNWQFTSCAVMMYGVLVEGGASLSLADSIVEQVGDYPLQGCQSGVDVEAGNSVTGQIGHLAMSGDTIESYQKNGVVVDGPGSTARISGISVSGAGPTTAIAQNGIQVSVGATASVIGSTITGDNYTGTGEASSAGILVFGGGGKVCGNGTNTPLVKRASFTRNTLINNDVGILLFNVNNGCDKSVHTATRDLACYNTIRNYHGYPGGVPSADANISGLVTTKYGAIGDQAGVSDSGDRDVICHNYITGAGYSSRDKTSTLPNPRPPAWVRPVDIFSYAPAYKPDVYANKYDGKAYKPR
jgi:hypothetical protein